MRNIINKLLAALVVLLTTSCDALDAFIGGQTVEEYSSHQAYYTMDFSLGHESSYLYEAVSSTNVFTAISVAGATTYTLVSEKYGAETNNETVSESILTQRTRQLGLKNGLLVGRSSFQDGQLYVFDRQCPNCWNANTYGNYPVKFSDAHNVVCNACHRTYGLLNGGVVVAGDGGEKLFRYRASYNGKVFQVTNP